MLKIIDNVFSDYALEPCIDIEQAYVENLFKPPLWQRVFSTSNPVVRISTVIGQFEIEIAFGEISKIIIEDLNSKRILNRFLEKKLVKIAKDGKYFIGIKEVKRHSRYNFSFKECGDLSHTLPNPRPPLYQNDVGSIIGNAVIVDAILNKSNRVNSFNPFVGQAVSKFDFPVKYVLTDYPFWLMENVHFFLPIKFSHFMDNCMAGLKTIDWHPFVRIIGTLEQQGEMVYLNAGLVFKRIAPPFGDIENWNIGGKTLEDIVKSYTNKTMFISSKEISKYINQLLDSPKWTKRLDIHEREAFFFLFPSISYLIYKINNLSSCPSPKVSELAQKIIRIGQKYYESVGMELKEKEYLNELLTYFE